MSDWLNEIYTFLSRLWDWLTYPFDFIGKCVEYGNAAWGYTQDLLTLFPAWFTGTISLVFVLAVVLFVIKR